jgi:TRAP-type C4-dicarboxylate transport system substrate-binding protein
VEGLPNNLQEILTEAAKQAERETHARVKQQVAEERKKLLDARLQVVKLSDADAYSKLAKEKGWEDVMKVAPKNGAELRKLLTK